MIFHEGIMGRHIVFVLSICPSVSPSQFVSATPLKLLNRISWNLVGSKDTICSSAYYQEILIARILWELCPFELINFPKYTSEASCQHNSSETTEQNFSWNLVGSMDTICSCAYYQDILIAWILLKLFPFKVGHFPKYTSEAACQHNSSEITEQNFMKHGR